MVHAAKSLSPLTFSLSQIDNMQQLLTKQCRDTLITTMCYVRVFRNGRMLYLSSDETWLKTYYNNDFYNAAEHTGTYISQGQESYYYWPGIETDSVYEAAVANNMCYGFNIRKSYSDYYEVFIFNTGPENAEMANFYINQLPFLKQLAQLFKTQILQDILPKTKDLYLLNSKVLEAIKDIEMQYQFDQSISKINLNRLMIDDKHCLSKRELECLYWTCLGKSAEEISMLLSISRRTVESHFYNLKLRFNSINKTQLVHKIYQDCPEFKDLFR